MCIKQQTDLLQIGNRIKELWSQEVIQSIKALTLDKAIGNQSWKNIHYWVKEHRLKEL